MSQRLQTWSCGGGTQSAAIAALIVQGRLPKPDLAAIVDTEREKTSTWEYYDAVLKPELGKVGVTLHRVPKSDFATVDLYRDGEALLLPVFTTQGGAPGKLPTYCANEWKRRVHQRWLRAQGVTKCDVWIGISVDEMRRMRFSSEPWYRHQYPLIDLRLRRSDCLRIVREVGWPAPPRSACWMCSNMGNAEWREMKTNHPADFAKACALEVELRQKDPYAWLHESCRPLTEVDFDAQG